MLPFQTDEFDPADPGLVERVHQSPCLHEGFHIGASGHDLAGEPWICMATNLQGLPMHVAYPLPMLEGEDVHQALVRFEGEWHREARRIGLYDRSREFQEAERIRTTRPPVNPLLVPIVRARKRPKPRSHELQGAIVLPGLEEWIKPGAKAW